MEETYGLSLIDVLRGYGEKGFKEQFRTLPGGLVECDACKNQGEARSLRVEDSARIEGVSDPAEETFAAAVQCPRCKARGTLVLAFGPRARRADVEVLQALPRGPR